MKRLLIRGLQLITCTCLACLVLVTAGASQEVIRYTAGTIDHDPRQDYFIQMLRLALDASGEGDHYRLEPVIQPVSQERAFTLAAHNQGLDIFWGMTSKEREQKALTVKIPLLKGLLGYRVLVTRSEWVADLATVQKREDLARYSIAQGFGWPDNTILSKNGLAVQTGNYHALFDWIAQKRADVLPRSIFEVWQEEPMIQRRGLMIAPSPALYYFGPIYFFVPQNNPKLARNIEKGLHSAIKDGRFDQLFNAQMGVKKTLVFLEKANPHQVLYLTNPDYSESEIQAAAKTGYFLIPIKPYSTAE
jgi:hypothetical protein